MVIPTTSESSAQEAKKLADELQKLFTSKTTSGGSHKRVSGRVTIVDMAEDKTLQKPVPPPSPPRLHRTENIVPTPSSTSTSSVKPPFEMNSEKTSPIPITPSSPVGSQHSPDDNGRLETQTPATSSLPPVRAEQEDLDYVENDHHYESGMTSINSRNLQKNFHNHPAQPQRSNILLVKSSAPAPPSSPEDSLYRRRPMSSQMAPSQPGERHNHDRRIVRPPPHFIPPSQANNRFGSAASANWEEEQDSESDDDYGPQSQSSYVQDSNNNPRDPLKAMGNMIQLVTDVYKRGRDGLDVAGFLRVGVIKYFLCDIHPMQLEHVEKFANIFAQKSWISFAHKVFQRYSNSLIISLLYSPCLSHLQTIMAAKNYYTVTVGGSLFLYEFVFLANSTTLNKTWTISALNPDFNKAMLSFIHCLTLLHFWIRISPSKASELFNKLNFLPPNHSSLKSWNALVKLLSEYQNFCK